MELRRGYIYENRHLAFSRSKLVFSAAGDQAPMITWVMIGDSKEFAAKRLMF